MGQLLAVDFGSTFTKVRAIDADDGVLLASGQASTTLIEGVMKGLLEALGSMGNPQLANLDSYDDCLATSSAAGGLRIVAIGLVQDLTAEAARRAALGAGGRIVGTFSGELTRSDRDELRKLEPDLIVLAGGTDGGDRKCIVANARALAETEFSATIIVAGNFAARDEVEDIFVGGGHVFEIVSNVLPAIRELNIAPCSEAIRRAFIARIVRAKGISVAEGQFGRVVMPTPRAVLDGCVLLSHGGHEEPGIGELVCFDVGGATTDVYSIADGAPSEGRTIQRGLPEPYAKRTVEGDLGVRVSAAAVVEAAEKERLPFISDGFVVDATDYVRRISENIGHLPESSEERALDLALAQTAVRIAMRRHAGRIELTYDPHGESFVQIGKDLRPIRSVVGTGGILSSSEHGTASKICEIARWDPEEPYHLLPRNPEVLVDHDYVLFAAGLLADKYPDPAMRLVHQSLRAD
jgi:uncharacterized protein (TIGR01319 family)